MHFPKDMIAAVVDEYRLKSVIVDSILMNSILMAITKKLVSKERGICLLSVPKCKAKAACSLNLMFSGPCTHSYSVCHLCILLRMASQYFNIAAWSIGTKLPNFSIGVVFFIKCFVKHFSMISRI